MANRRTVYQRHASSLKLKRCENFIYTSFGVTLEQHHQHANTIITDHEFKKSIWQYNYRFDNL